MANILKLLAIFVAFTYVIYPGDANYCSVETIEILQRPTGETVSGHPEFLVTIRNTCPCQQSNVRLYISGFQTVEPVPRSILDKDGYVNNKMPLTSPSDGLTFRYASENGMFPFRPISSQVSCS